jgi:hypothetical protein
VFSVTSAARFDSRRWPPAAIIVPRPIVTRVGE